MRYCGQCGEHSAASMHTRCQELLKMEPPRFCAACRRRMVVQVVPAGWTARCVEHGTIEQL